MKKEIVVLTLDEEKLTCGGVYGNEGRGRFRQNAGRGQGQGGGRGQGLGQGQGQGSRSGLGPGQGLGLGGFCVCPDCGAKRPHQRGAPCMSINCTECDVPMARK